MDKERFTYHTVRGKRLDCLYELLQKSDRHGLVANTGRLLIFESRVKKYYVRFGLGQHGPYEISVFSRRSERERVYRLAEEKPKLEAISVYGETRPCKHEWENKIITVDHVDCYGGLRCKHCGAEVDPDDYETIANDYAILFEMVMTKTSLCPFGGSDNGRNACSFGHPGCACEDYLTAVREE